MIFQTLDDKNECVAVYCEDKLIFGDVPENVSKTWSYSQFLKGKDIDYANLYCEGKSLEEICPESIKPELTRANNMLKAFIRSFVTAKVSLKDNCFFELTPNKFLVEYCKIKNKITQHIFENYKKPAQYDFLKDMTEFITDISFKPINVNLEKLEEQIVDQDSLELYKKYKNYGNVVKYDLFGTVTGRLSSRENSFPILRLNKKHRAIIEPNNDWFVELDINAAEMRTAIALSGGEQFDGDLYSHINSTIYNDILTRDEAKKKTTLWLYNNKSHNYDEYNKKLENLFKKTKLLKDFYKNGKICTPYDRCIEVEEEKAVNYLTQSTFIDLFHRQILKCYKYLGNHQTYIPFLIHDGAFLDLKDEEKRILPEIIRILSDTPYGKFNVGVKIGKNLGEMKKIKIKV